MDFEGKIDLSKESVNKLVNSIKYEKKSLVIFAGAGISALFGLPLWNDFANKLLEDCYNDHLITEYQIYDDYKRIIGSDSKMLITLVYNLYKDNGKKSLFIKHFTERLSLDKSKDAFSKKYERFKMALRSMNVSVITTNADQLLDSVITNDGKIYYSKSFFEKEFDKNNNLGPFVMHIHGSILDPESLVFTMDQYLERYGSTNHIFSSIMETIFRDQNLTILFIGSSMSEMELLQYMVKSSPSASNKFILNGFFDYQSDLEKSTADYYNTNFGISQISYSFKQKGFNSIIDFVDELSKEIQTTPGIKESFYNSIINDINIGEIDSIVSSMSAAIDNGLSLPILSNLFEQINKKEFASEIFRLLYEKKFDIFDVKKYSKKSNSIQNVMLTELSYCKNVINKRLFLRFINNYISYIDTVMKQKDFNYEDSYKIVISYIAFLNMSNTKQNQDKLIRLIKKLFEKNVSYISTIFYSLRAYELNHDTLYALICTFLSAHQLKSEGFEFYEIDSYIKRNFNIIMGYKALDFFKFIRNLILKIDNKSKFKYGDLGAIFDYIDSRSSFVYEKYLIKLVKNIIDNILPSQIITAFDSCETNSKMDRKIKLYFVDKYFSKLKDKIDVELIDSIDSFASICWIIENHRSEIEQDKSYKLNLIHMINNCIFSQEEKIDRDGLVRILLDLLDNKDYKTDFDIKSRFKYYDYCNIGKVFWSSSVQYDDEKIYSKIKDKDIKEVINYINDNQNYDFDLDDALEKYFDKAKLGEILSNPNLFFEVKNSKLYSSILKKLYYGEDTIDVDKQLLIIFLKEVINKCCNDENAWLWIEIIKKNNLIYEEEVAEILQKVFNVLVIKDNVYDFNSDYIFFFINNTLFHCFELLCEYHIQINDIMDYISEVLSKYSDNQNKSIILSSIAYKYDRIYNCDASIKKTIIELINMNNSNSLSIFNGLIFSEGSNKFELIKDESFKKNFSLLDNSAIDYYSQVILLYYMNFDLDLVTFAAKNSKMDLSSQIINAFLNNHYGDLEILIDILDCYAQNPNIEINLSKELLDLLNNKFSNAKLRKVIETIANHKYSYLEWNELESSFISILEKDESYFIKSIFVPLCNQYLIENKYYVEEEFYEVFDKIYSLLKDDNNISVMKNTASLAFDYGLVNFKKYN